MNKSTHVLNQAPQTIPPILEKLNPFLTSNSKISTSGELVEAKDFVWASYPGGFGILNGVRDKMEINDEQLPASGDVRRNHGNASSVRISVVFEQLRKMGKGRENVMACGFELTMTIETAILNVEFIIITTMNGSTLCPQLRILDLMVALLFQIRSHSKRTFPNTPGEFTDVL